jgi:hypothetical protein
MIAIFGDFRQFSAKRMAFFSLTNVTIKIFHNLALFWVKRANFFRQFFLQKYFKIITSAPGKNVFSTVGKTNWRGSCRRKVVARDDIFNFELETSLRAQNKTKILFFQKSDIFDPVFGAVKRTSDRHLPTSGFVKLCNQIEAAFTLCKLGQFDVGQVTQFSYR